MSDQINLNECTSGAVINPIDELRQQAAKLEKTNTLQEKLLDELRAKVAELEISWRRDIYLAGSRVNQLEEYNGKLTEAIDNYLNDTRGRPAVEALEQAMKLYGYQDRVNQ